MTPQIYSYSLLQYKHSPALGETLNIGVLVYFHDSKFVTFLHPERLGRVKDAYSDFSEKVVKNYFSFFNEKIFAANSQSNLFAHENLDKSFNFFLADLLPPDSSSLQFSEINTGVSYASEQKTLENLESIYLSEFNKDSFSNDRIEEAIILSKYKKRLKEIDPNLQEHKKKLIYNYIIEPIEGTPIKFDVAWQNGSLNLLKPASFDFLKADTIQKKAWRYFGQFTDLQDVAKAQNYRFDLLIAKPKKIELFKTFDNAIRLLGKPERVKLIFEDEIEAYSQKTIEALKEDDNGKES